VKFGRGFVVAAAALAASVITAACDREDLTVATLATNLTPDASDAAAAAPDASDASSEADADDDQRCTVDEDCPGDEYCNRQGCGQFGSCQSSTCEGGEGTTSAPECGCNNVTYYNSCLRQLDSQSLRSEGPCRDDGIPDCVNQSQCKSLGVTRGEIFCARLVSGMHTCDDDAPGTCWVLPHNCTEITDGTDDPIWRACDSPDLTCESQCQAIANGVPYSYAEGVCQ
jgi:hypothetical protein